MDMGSGEVVIVSTKHGNLNLLGLEAHVYCKLLLNGVFGALVFHLMWTPTLRHTSVFPDSLLSNKICFNCELNLVVSYTFIKETKQTQSIFEAFFNILDIKQQDSNRENRARLNIKHTENLVENYTPKAKLVVNLSKNNILGNTYTPLENDSALSTDNAEIQKAPKYSLRKDITISRWGKYLEENKTKLNFLKSRSINVPKKKKYIVQRKVDSVPKLKEQENKISGDKEKESTHQLKAQEKKVLGNKVKQNVLVSPATVSKVQNVPAKLKDSSTHSQSNTINEFVKLTKRKRSSSKKDLLPKKKFKKNLGTASRSENDITSQKQNITNPDEVQKGQNVNVTYPIIFVHHGTPNASGTKPTFPHYIFQQQTTTGGGSSVTKPTFPHYIFQQQKNTGSVSSKGTPSKKSASTSKSSDKEENSPKISRGLAQRQHQIIPNVPDQLKLTPNTQIKNLNPLKLGSDIKLSKQVLSIKTLTEHLNELLKQNMKTAGSSFQPHLNQEFREKNSVSTTSKMMPLQETKPDSTVALAISKGQATPNISKLKQVGRISKKCKSSTPLKETKLNATPFSLVQKRTTPNMSKMKQPAPDNVIHCKKFQKKCVSYKDITKIKNHNTPVFVHAKRKLENLDKEEVSPPTVCEPEFVEVMESQEFALSNLMPEDKIKDKLDSDPKCVNPLLLKPKSSKRSALTRPKNSNVQRSKNLKPKKPKASNVNVLKLQDLLKRKTRKHTRNLITSTDTKIGADTNSTARKSANLIEYLELKKKIMKENNSELKNSNISIQQPTQIASETLTSHSGGDVLFDKPFVEAPSSAIASTSDTTDATKNLEKIDISTNQMPSEVTSTSEVVDTRETFLDHASELREFLTFNVSNENNSLADSSQITEVSKKSNVESSDTVDLNISNDISTCSNQVSEAKQVRVLSNISLSGASSPSLHDEHVDKVTSTENYSE